LDRPRKERQYRPNQSGRKRGCKIAVTYTDCPVRLARSEASEDRAVADLVGIVVAERISRGTHVNIAGGAVASFARNR
jgi:iron(III) transport system substrate-binding protein